MSVKSIRNLREKVIHILKEYPKSRDSDQWLTLKLWTVYFPTRVIIDPVTHKAMIALTDIMELPREDNIKRCRAKIQNEEHLYLPTTVEVARKRHINEEDWRNWANNQTRCE
jgi:CubicO group peptidase (beta-lactamase class C family)